VTPSRRTAKSIALVGALSVVAVVVLLSLVPVDGIRRDREENKVSSPPKFVFGPWAAGPLDRDGAPTARIADRPEGFPAPAGENQLVPEEWEAPLFGILLDTNGGMDTRNARLLELATRNAIREPLVQQECLRHLLFGLSDDDGALFLAIATNPVVSLRMRSEFLKEALVLRPTQLGEWLSGQLGSHHEPEIRQLALRYLLGARGKNQ